MAEDNKPRRASGYQGEYPAEFAAPRRPSLAQRAFRGDFQIQRAAPAPAVPINVGMGGATADSPRPAQRPSPVRAASSIAAPIATAAAAPAPRQAAPAAAASVPRPSFAGVRTDQPNRVSTFSGPNLGMRTVGADGTASPAANATGGLVVRPAAEVLRAFDAPAERTGVQAPASNAPAIQQSVVRALDAQRGQTRAARADAAEILNPMSHSAELMRRLENSQRSYFNKGSPQARRLIGEAYAAQLGAQNAASAQGLRSAGDTIERGLGYEAGAMEGAARRQLDADMFNTDDSYRNRALQAEIERPTLQADAQGNLLSIAGTAATPVTGADGGQVRLARPAEAGQITPAALLEAYSQQARAISEGLGTPEEKAQQQAALRADPIYAGLFAQAQGNQRAAPPAAAIERLRANPAAAAQFDEIFGPGSAAQYLNR